MSKTANQNNVTLVQNQPFIDIRNARVEGVGLDSTTVDSTNTPTTQLRKGLVVGFDSAGGNYVDAGDALVDAHTSGVLTSAEAPDSDWQTTTLIITVPGQGTYTHTWAGTVTNLATAITDWEANAGNSLASIADDGGGLAEFTAIKPGVTLSLTPSLATAFTNGAVEHTNAGSLTKYGILAETVPSMLGIDDAVEDKIVSIVTANAIVREADLLELTTAARQWFDANDIQLA